MSVDGRTTIVSAARRPMASLSRPGEHRTEERAEEEHVHADHGDAP